MFHQKQRDFLRGKFLAGQLSHAYLLAGPEGVGKRQFAKELVKMVNGNMTTSDAVIEKEQFPDLMVVRSINSDSSVKNEKDMMEIDVAQIRAVNHFLWLKSYYGGYKAVIIENADRMNVEAQNCFLKTLEEPKGKTLILLLSSRPDVLLQTIFSRCQVISLLEKARERVSLNADLQKVLGASLAEKFLYAKNVNLEGGNFEQILEALQHYWRSDTAKNRSILKLALELERRAQVSNINKKLALEVLLLEL